MSIARGIEATDEMVKVADVELLLSRTVCSGKYITMVGGDVSGVERAMDVGVEIQAKRWLINSSSLMSIPQSSLRSRRQHLWRT